MPRLKIPKLFSSILFFLLAMLYPAFMYYFLVIRQAPLRLISLFVIAFALVAFIAGTSRQKGKPKGFSFLWSPLLLLGVGVLCLVANFAVILKFYPLLMNVMFLTVFGMTCFFPPTMIFRFATLQDKTIAGSLGEKKIAAYCRKVTYAWCAFFVFNGSVAAWTIFFGSDAVWAVYNGGISYILIGTFFIGEFLIRKMVQKNVPRAVPLSAIRCNSRPLSAVLCYDGVYGESAMTWEDFLTGTAVLRRCVEAAGGERWLLYCEDCWHFLLAFTALLQCKKEVLISANMSPAYNAEINSGVALLTDQALHEGESPKNTFSVPDLLRAGLPEGQVPADRFPTINADETSIVMYTSGSTGKPKEVRQRLTEFENDNRFVLSQWGEEFLKRKVCSTVNQHHIYGLLYSVLLPFTAGVPFRRKRIEFPEELEKLTDTEYMLITVPAFLKRAVEIEKSGGLRLKSPWIFTSGGVLSPEVARKTSEVFGFWPVEVYGSTETSGIAWRQSANGLEWTPFDNAQLSKNQDGCLVIRSPYIKDPDGFETADMVDILEGGRFLLRGRLDSVVKIEEKRISLTEVESRILQSGLVADVCVISLEGKRQYLAAAVALNEKGKEQFAGQEKHRMYRFWREYLLRYFENLVIPKKWRYLDSLPADAQGKKRKDDITRLFTGEKTGTDGFLSLERDAVIEKTENSVSVEFTIPDSSPYFDGHFPQFPILPAVAQMELVIRFASRYFGTPVTLSEIRRIKFTSLIQPNMRLLLKLVKKENALAFNISSPKGETAYSNGTVVLGKE